MKENPFVAKAEASADRLARDIVAGQKRRFPWYKAPKIKVR